MDHGEQFKNPAKLDHAKLLPGLENFSTENFGTFLDHKNLLRFLI